MDHLFTPWRMAYIRGDKSGGDTCVFCAAPALPEAEGLVVARGQHVYALLNRFPYSNGHVMIAPYAHVATPEALDGPALIELAQMTNQAMAALRAVYQPSAFNIGANIGAAAGAGIAAHYHFHIVPRWAGDANFMTVVGATRVVPDTLENTFRELKAAWAAQTSPPAANEEIS